MEEVEAFRYRAKDAWRAITRSAVHETRLREIKMEIFNNEKLKGFFNENARDLNVLRHDKPLKTIKVQPHLSHVPEYIVPKALKRIAATPLTTSTSSSEKKPRYFQSSAKAAYESKSNNPLLCSELDFGKKPGGNRGGRKRK